MVGENPAAAEGQGLSVARLRIGAVMAGSALMGVAGAFLTLAAFNAFYFNMVNGRGWVCVALVVFASLAAGQGAARRAAVRPLRCAAAAAATVRRRRLRRLGAVSGLSDAALPAFDRRPRRHRAPRGLSAGADEAVSQGGAVGRRRHLFEVGASVRAAAAPARSADCGAATTGLRRPSSRSSP